MKLGATFEAICFASFGLKRSIISVLPAGISDKNDQVYFFSNLSSSYSMNSYSSSGSFSFYDIIE
jgi:hypothetical protein